MFTRLAELRDALFAARFLREEVHDMPLAPDTGARLREAILADNAAAAPRAALLRAVELGRTADWALVTEEALDALAEASGARGFRTHAGSAFEGKAAPSPSRIPALLGELLETVNSPLAMESWPAPVRAFALHFLLRLVQPFQAPAAAVAQAAEAMVLAADGFAADLVLLPEADAGVSPAATRPDPDAFAAARLDRLVERLGATRDRVRDAAARALLAAWALRREARLSARERSLVRWLAEKDGPPRIAFQEYVDLHAGRRAPSLRSLQRDFQRLRERGVLRADGEGHALDLRFVAYGR